MSFGYTSESLPTGVSRSNNLHTEGALGLGRASRRIGLDISTRSNANSFPPADPLSGDFSVRLGYGVGFFGGGGLSRSTAYAFPAYCWC